MKKTSVILMLFWMRKMEVKLRVGQLAAIELGVELAPSVTALPPLLIYTQSIIHSISNHVL